MAGPSGARTALFAQLSDDALLGYGVPAEWLTDVRAADEDALMALTDHLPKEAAEALLELTTGGTAPGGIPCAQTSGQPRVVGYFLRATGQRFAPETAAVDWQHALTC